MTCKAVRQSDEMFCAACNMRWEAGSPSYCPNQARAAAPWSTPLNISLGAGRIKGLHIQPLEFAMLNRWDAAASFALVHLSGWRAARQPDEEIRRAREAVQGRLEMTGLLPSGTLRAGMTMQQYVAANLFKGLGADALYALEDLVLHGGDDRYERAVGTIDLLAARVSQMGFAA